MNIILHNMRLPVSMKIAAAAFCAAAALSCSSGGDPYLKTLQMDMERLEAVDSINVDRYDLFQARSVVKADNGWLALFAACMRPRHIRKAVSIDLNCRRICSMPAVDIGELSLGQKFRIFCNFVKGTGGQGI